MLCLRAKWTLPAPVLAMALLPSFVDGQIVINEICASNNQTATDDENDSPDWIELYNASTSLLPLAGYTLSDDVDNPQRWEFPELFLAPGQHLLVWCSGKDRTEPTVAVTSLAVHLDDRFAPRGGEWRYFPGSADAPEPPPGWTEVSFDDSEWATGRAPLGFGSHPVETTVPVESTGLLLRRRFLVEDSRLIPNLFLEVDYDDGFLAYVNGQPVAAGNFRKDDIPDFTSRSRGTNAPGSPRRFDISESRDALRSGENVLAVFSLNVGTRPGHPQHDLYIEPRLGTVPSSLHTNFSLRREGGETLILSDPSGTAVDSVTLPPQVEDRTYGRFPNGSGDFTYFYVPTPRAANDPHTSPTAPPAPTPPTLLPPSGHRSTPVDVEITVDLPFDDYEIRYTIDGDWPSPESLLYESPLHLEKDTVVRAAAFTGGRMATRIGTHTYFGINTENSALELPVMSISMNDGDFAFVHGSNFGRGRAFERRGHLEIFSETGEAAVSTDFGLRLHGGAGRGGDFATKKAYRAYFRALYGNSRLEFPLFPDSPVESFSRLVLRSNFNDAFRVGTERAALIRDQVIRDLFADMGGVISHGTWYNLFVNLEYRGIYNVVERMDENFFRAHFPEEDDWDVIKTGSEVLEGDLEAWNQLHELVLDTSLSDDASYDEVAAMVDIANFTSYIMVNMWAQNTDWPGNNWYAARPRTEGGRWIFLSWDAEFGVGLSPQGYEHDTFRHVVNSRGTRLGRLFVALLGNAGYREFFLEQLDVLLDGPLSAENVVAHVDRLADRIAPDMEEELRAVGAPIAAWEADIDNMRTFAEQRSEVFRSLVLASNELSDGRRNFLRGDVDGDARRNLRDAVLIAQYLSGRWETFCEDALDVDDSDAVDLTDVLYLANYLFLSGSPPPAPPFDACGRDPSGAAIRCNAAPEGCPD